MPTLGAGIVRVENDPTCRYITGKDDSGVRRSKLIDCRDGHCVRFADTSFARLFIPAVPLFDGVITEITAFETRSFILNSAIAQRHVRAYLEILVMPRMYGTSAFGTSTDPSARRKFSTMAAHTRGTASAEAFKVWAISVPF